MRKVLVCVLLFRCTVTKSKQPIGAGEIERSIQIWQSSLLVSYRVLQPTNLWILHLQIRSWWREQRIQSTKNVCLNIYRSMKPSLKHNQSTYLKFLALITAHHTIWEEFYWGIFNNFGAFCRKLKSLLPIILIFLIINLKWTLKLVWVLS